MCLDLGTGGGENVLKNYPDVGMIIATDFSKKMIYTAKENAKQIYDCLAKDGTLVIEGIDKEDCWELKELFGRGQAYNDEISISEKDYNNLKSNILFWHFHKLYIFFLYYYDIMI